MCKLLSGLFLAYESHITVLCSSYTETKSEGKGKANDTDLFKCLKTQTSPKTFPKNKPVQAGQAMNYNWDTILYPSPKNSDLLIKYLKLFINNILSICERDQLYYVYRSTLFLWTSFWEHSNKINIYLYRIIVGFCTQQTKGAISGTVPGLYELYVWISTYRYKLCGSITCNFVLYNLYFTSHHK